MMDELELLKKDWQKKWASPPRLSYNQIYEMIWKKSSSFIKWIFYISLAEFAFWIGLSFIPINSEELKVDRNQGLIIINKSLEVIYFLVLVFFISRFYRNYKKITATDSAKDLMKKIINTRKTVMQYVWFNIIYFAITMVIIAIEYVVMNPEAQINSAAINGENEIVYWLVASLVLIGFIVVFALLIWLFYRLIYGILLKRLNENYNELKKLEV